VKYFILFVLLSVSSPIWAGFVNNKTDWDGMSYSQKLGYVQGAFDEHTLLSTQDSDEMTALKEHRMNCVVDMRMSSAGMVELIDNMYRNDVGIWQYSPNIAMIQGLYKMCGMP